jgi:hypothetical protein
MSGGAPRWDRFAFWSKGPARLALAALAALLVLSALVPISRGLGRDFVPSLIEGGPPKTKLRDDDLTVYDHVIERLQRGESYYPAAAAEHRIIGFPLTPGLAVRLPTLVWFYSLIGEQGERIFAILLLIVAMIVWWRRLGSEPGAEERRLLGISLIALNAVLVLNVYFYRLHELSAGMLLAISFGLHRPGKWFPAILPAAAALAIRELALPYVLLMAAMALWRRDLRETAAWSLLAVVFLIGLAVHLHLVAEQVRPGDYVSRSWFALRGLSGLLENMIFTTNFRYLPHFLAGPLVILALLGWAGWRSAAGTFGVLLFLGYGLAFMIAGRDENYYWGMMITPTLALGLAFTPMAVKSLVRAAFARPDGGAKTMGNAA